MADPTFLYRFATNKSLTGEAGPTLSITNANGSYYNASGTLVKPSSNTARFDHDPSDSNASLGLLIEAAATNQLLQSEDVSTSWSNDNSTDETDQTTAPDGTSTADRITVDGVFNSLQGINQNVSTLDRTVSWCLSCFVKADTHSYFQLAMNGVFGNRVRQNFDLTDGSIGSTEQVGEAGAITSTIKDVGGGWYRVSMASVLQTTAGTGVVSRLHLCENKTNTGNWTSSSDDALFVWGMQIELGTRPSSYIPTTTGAVTRTADAVTTTTLSWLDTAATAVGTWYIRGRFREADTAARALLTLDDGGTTDRFYFERDAAENINFAVTNSADNDGLVSGTNVISADTEVEVAASYADDDLAMAVDNTLETGDTSVGIPLTDNPTTLRLGADSGGNYWNGHIAEVRYYDRQKTDGQITTLSNGAEIGDASETTASVPSTAQQGASVSITVTVKDLDGTNLGTGGDTVVINVSGANTATPTVTDVGDGTYTASYTATNTGSDSVAITLNGVAISGSPYSVTVSAASAGPASEAASVGTSISLGVSI